MFSQFVFVLKTKIKQAFPCLVHMEIFVLIELTISYLSGILAHTLADLEAEGRLESHGAIVVAVVVHQVVLLILQGVLRV